MDLTVETALGRNLDPLQHEMLCEASTRDIREADFWRPVRGLPMSSENPCLD
jgi:hypothetical protein